MATETILSPGVLLQETDNTLVFPGIDPSGMAIIGPTARGPVEIPTQVTNYQQFKRIFGTTIRSGSQAYELFTNLSVKNYFNNGGSYILWQIVIFSIFAQYPQDLYDVYGKIERKFKQSHHK